MQLKAIPKEGWRFVRWEMDGEGLGVPKSLCLLNLHGWCLEKWDDMANGQLSRSLIIKKDEGSL